MFRPLSRATRAFAIAATVAFPAVAAAQSDTRPIVVVFRFDNNSIGAGRADFDGMATGVQDLLITDLASNPKVRIVDRAHLNDILAEQNLAKTGQVDPTTAVRIGKILGAQYAITGGFMSDGKGAAVVTGRTIDVETTQIANPQKITGKTDDVLGLITELSSKLSANLSLAPKPGMERRGDAGAALPPTGQAAPSQAASNVKSAPQPVELYRKPLTKPASMKTKLDVATMKTYSNACDEMERKNNAKARELFQQVVNKYPDFEPAQRNLKALSAQSGN